MNTSSRYICSGSSVRSPSLNAGRGVVGIAIASTVCERVLEVAANQRADLLRLQIIGVVVAGAQHVGAQHDAPFHLVAELLVARPLIHRGQVVAAFSLARCV